MTSQLVIFRAFFSAPPPPPSVNLKEKSRKSTNKKNLASVDDKFIATAGKDVNSCGPFLVILLTKLDIAQSRIIYNIFLNIEFRLGHTTNFTNLSTK